MELIVLMNVIIWAFIITFLLRGKLVRYEMKAGSVTVVVLLFFLLGLIQYMSKPSLYSFITFISITLAGMVYIVIPSGIGENEFIILGRKYPYENVKYLDISEENNRLQLKFEYKHRVKFLFAQKDQEDEIRQILKKYYRR